jgi:hypothetical protein
MADNGVSTAEGSGRTAAHKRSRDIQDEDPAVRDGEIDIDGRPLLKSDSYFADDDDVGPMPMEDAPKKKRKGIFS